ncbi:D-sedoheptulose-7-phosphate isomerase [Actinorugispora endophytica]|uniref:Phosphoheptose isomerase n=1 Tax=Actinorugispora endophytica TaxID=1605990 RepID=A0A4V3D8F3_9ACTN|nr:SIS domain-containing protein [Actinorugispora endophytica]TDQ51537.1 phosphoheptose isomerase [Actinorugispora endophytica]
MHAHLEELRAALAGTDTERVEAWGRTAAAALRAGRRLFACGNGGSAAEAQHLTAELTGRFENERRPLSAIALHAETSSVTAIANDYGFRQVYARQLRAHARPGDMLVCLSTSGASDNVVAAAVAAREIGVTCWSMTGSAPSALAAASDEVVAVPAARASTVQEVHLALVHLFCEVVDAGFAPAGLVAQAAGPRKART